jgi:hypothetical protein
VRCTSEVQVGCIAAALNDIIIVSNLNGSTQRSVRVPQAPCARTLSLPSARVTLTGGTAGLGTKAWASACISGCWGSHRAIALVCKWFRFANRLRLGFNAAARRLQVAVVAARRLFYLLLLADELRTFCSVQGEPFSQGDGQFLVALESELQSLLGKFGGGPVQIVFVIWILTIRNLVHELQGLRADIARVLNSERNAVLRARTHEH